eukprot:2908204-Pyramimonas_sp.AAC.1
MTFRLFVSHQSMCFCSLFFSATDMTPWIERRSSMPVFHDASRGAGVLDGPGAHRTVALAVAV